MKCFETEKNIDLLLDDEANDLQKQELKAHLVICETCQTELQLRQQTQILLKDQPPILPASEFDKRMFAAFENKVKLQGGKNPWAAFFLIPKPAFAVAIALFGLALAFLLGRVSVASPPQINVSNAEKNSEKIIVAVTPTPEIKEVVITKPEIKTVTKYVEIPVIKEKVVEKIVYVEKSSRAKQPKIKTLPIQSKDEFLAVRIRLQPIENVTFQIIKKGEDNEK